MRKIRLTLEIEGVRMSSEINEEQYVNIKNNVGLDPMILLLDQMWEEINKHDNLKDNPLSR